jgi:hypothetical protein
VNTGSLSETMDRGTPWRRMMSEKNTWAMDSAVYRCARCGCSDLYHWQVAHVRKSLAPHAACWGSGNHAAGGVACSAPLHARRCAQP